MAAVSSNPASIKQLVGQVDAGEEVRSNGCQGLYFSLDLSLLHQFHLQQAQTGIFFTMCARWSRSNKHKSKHQTGTHFGNRLLWPGIFPDLTSGLMGVWWVEGVWCFQNVKRISFYKYLWNNVVQVKTHTSDQVKKSHKLHTFDLNQNLIKCNKLYEPVMEPT